jgi:hypothetical protein
VLDHIEGSVDIDNYHLMVEGKFLDLFSLIHGSDALHSRNCNCQTAPATRCCVRGTERDTGVLSTAIGLQLADHGAGVSAAVAC